MGRNNFHDTSEVEPYMTDHCKCRLDGPDIASRSDTVYVVVKRTPETSDTNRIFIFTSFNGGIAFNTPVELGFIADSISRFPTVTTDATFNPIVAYMKFNASFMNSRWVVLKSTDYGSTISTDVKASGWEIQQRFVIVAPVQLF